MSIMLGWTLSDNGEKITRREEQDNLEQRVVVVDRKLRKNGTNGRRD